MRGSRVALATGAVVLLALSVFFAIRALRNELVIVNRSGQSLTDVSIEVRGGGSAFGISAIPNESEMRSVFDIGSDGDILFEAILADGTPVSAEGGYVSGGMHAERIRIIVGPGGAVEILQ